VVPIQTRFVTTVEKKMFVPELIQKKLESKKALTRRSISFSDISKEITALQGIGHRNQ